MVSNYNNSTMRARKQQAQANASHSQATDPLLSEEQRRAAMKNGTYVGEPEDKSKNSSPARVLPASTHSLGLMSDGPVMLFLLVAALALRFWNIGNPSMVVFDEVHFGKFASYYLRREYYFDVHPPFAKLLNALSGYLAGFKGNFDFENIADDYIKPGVPYVQMRALPAILGALKVPLVYIIMRETGHAKVSGLLSAILILLDNAHIAQDRLILLDATVTLFMTLSLYSYIKFYKQRYREFSFAWWFWIVSTGVNIALTTSSKISGLLIFFPIGLAVAMDLWRLLDIKRGLTMEHFAKHFAARAFALIFIPAAVYMFWFWVHFKILNHSGTGDNFMTAEFQQTLLGNPMLDKALTIQYGDEITMQHKETSAYLHSHVGRYPLRYDDGRVSSQGQQVTGYPHKDVNNIWIVEPVISIPESGVGRTVKNGHVIRLLHKETDSYLMTHDVASPLTTTNEEFTTIGVDEAPTRFNDTLFELQLISVDKGKPVPWKTRAGWFKLIHVPTRVAMHSYAEPVLPTWGWGQQEINGNKEVTDKANVWYVDDVRYNPETPDYEERIKPAPPKKVTSMNFFRKFIELQLQMLQQNAGLTQSHPYASGPINWPFLLQGISFWTHPDGEQRQIYFIGNLVSWWTSVLLVAVYMGVVGADALARRRGQDPITLRVRRRLGNSVGFFVTAWACHYFPFFLMGRQTFLHHYLPAHICACMVAGAMFQFIAIEEVDGPLSAPGPLLAATSSIANSGGGRKAPHTSSGVLQSLPEHKSTAVLPQPARLVVALIVALLVGVFLFLAPFTYGLELTSKEVLKRKVLSTWSLHFLPSPSEIFG